jgi:hypothetical protein
MPILSPTQYDPAQLTVDPKAVEKRTTEIISGGGALQQATETQALQRMNQSGLLNTSMAIGEAQKARISAALPIASQEAQLSFAAQQQNIQASNQAKQFGAGYFQQLGLTEATGAQQRLGIEAQAQAESGLMAQKLDIDKQLLTANADEQIRLIAKKGQIDTALQELRGTQAVEQIETTEQVESRLIAQRAEISKQLIGAEGDVKEALVRQQGLLDLELSVQRGELASRLQNELFEINVQLESGRAEDLAELTRLKADIDTQLQGLIGSQALILQGLKGDQSAMLTRMEGDYKTLIATQQSAAQIHAQVSSSISNILANPDIPLGAKDTLIKYEMGILESSLHIMGAIADMDLSGLLVFSGSSVNVDLTGPLVTVTDTTGVTNTGDSHSSDYSLGLGGV